MLLVNEFLLRQAAKPSGQVNKEICIACLKVVRSDYQEKINLLVYCLASRIFAKLESLIHLLIIIIL